MKTMSDSNFFVELEKRCKLGEGAIWNHFSKRLLYVDIDGCKLFEFDPSSKREAVYNMPAEVGTVVPVDHRRVVVALADGIYLFDMKNKSLVKKASNPEPYRFNDGKCDSCGRLWVGTIETGSYSKPLCNLYSLDSLFKLKVKKERVTISNGIAWSPDNSILYYIDTQTRAIRAYSFDLQSGSIDTLIAELLVPKELGSPDGCTIDSDGKLWVALWQGAGVIRCDVLGKKIEELYPLPAYNVTSLAFGEDGLDTLYVTSSSSDMTDEMWESYPYSGSLLSLKTGHTGVKAKPFSLE